MTKLESKSGSILSERMASDRLLAYSQWYENGRKRGMGHKQAMERAVGILELPQEEADALLWGLTCAGEPTEYIEILCKGDPAPAFKIDGDYYCGACGSSTFLHRTPLMDLIDDRVGPARLATEDSRERVQPAPVPLLEPPGAPRDQPTEPA